MLAGVTQASVSLETKLWLISVAALFSSFEVSSDSLVCF